MWLSGREGRIKRSQPQDVAGPHLPPFERVQFWPNIEIETESLSGPGVVLAGVKVDDIVDLGTTAINDPVVPVEWLGVSEQVVDAGFWSQSGRVSPERDEFRSATPVEQTVSIRQSLCNIDPGDERRANEEKEAQYRHTVQNHAQPPTS